MFLPNIVTLMAAITIRHDDEQVESFVVDAAGVTTGTGFLHQAPAHQVRQMVTAI